MRRSEFWIEVEIRTDIFFRAASPSWQPNAEGVIQRLADTLAPFPNPIRVEGHTDNKPIKTVAFYSNWELSAARAGSVVRVLQTRGVNPARLAVIGYGEQRPVQSNDTEQGRNANRRVVVVILSTEIATSRLRPRRSPAPTAEALTGRTCPPLATPLASPLCFRQPCRRARPGECDAVDIRRARRRQWHGSCTLNNTTPVRAGKPTSDFIAPGKCERVHGVPVP